MTTRARQPMRSRLKRRAVAVATVAVLLSTLGGTASANGAEGVRGRSVFVDLGARPAWETAARIDLICREHRDPTGDSYIHNVVLVGVIKPGSGELRRDQLAAILPHVPGGGGEQCFDNVFVGPAVVRDLEDPWIERNDFPAGLEPWCADSSYCGGILTGSWRWDNVEANRRAADLFLEFVNEHYPGVRSNIQWYVTYEGYFDWFGDNRYSNELKNAYEAYILQLIREFREALVDAGEPEISSGRAILWSPSYEDDFEAHGSSELESIRANLRSMLSNVRARAYAEGIGRGLDWLHMQDRLGQIGCFTEDCYSSVASWYRFLASVNNEEFGFANLGVNMELFVPGPSPQGDPLEHRTRQDFYVANGVPIGASWELQFLIPQIPEKPRIDPPSLQAPLGGFVRSRAIQGKLPTRY